MSEQAKHTTGRCPSCCSYAPHLHPAVQPEGEVAICSDAFHLTPTNQNSAEYIALVKAKREKTLCRVKAEIEHYTATMPFMQGGELTEIDVPVYDTPTGYKP